MIYVYKRVLLMPKDISFRSLFVLQSLAHCNGSSKA